MYSIACFCGAWAGCPITGVNVCSHSRSNARSCGTTQQHHVLRPNIVRPSTSQAGSWSSVVQCSTPKCFPASTIGHLIRKRWGGGASEYFDLFKSGTGRRSVDRRCHRTLSGHPPATNPTSSLSPRSIKLLVQPPIPYGAPNNLSLNEPASGR